MTQFFGARWDTPEAEQATQVPTPLGQICERCEEPIMEGDRGVVMPMLTGALGEDGRDVWSMGAMHLECHIASAMSHMVEQCPCFVQHRSAREEALATLGEVNVWRGEQGLGPL